MDAKNLIRKDILKVKPYVPGKPVEEVQRELGLKSVVKLASNESATGPSRKACAALSSFLPKLHYYPDGSGFLLKNALSKKLSVRSENICLGCGSDELIHLLCLAYLNKGDEVVTCAPSFVIYETNTHLFGGKLKRVPLKDYTFDLDGIKKAVTEKTKLVFIANPNNPTGTIVRKKEVQKFLSGLHKKMLVVFDEAYCEYVSDKEYPDTLSMVREGKNVVALRTFSKIYGLAGLRIGYGAARADIVRYMDCVREPFNVNSAALHAACAALSDEAHVKKSCAVNESGKKYLYGELKKLGLFFVPTEANFIFVDAGVDSRKLFQAMLRCGVIVRTGDIFGLPAFIRVTIGKPHENKKFISALKKCLNEKIKN